MEGLRDMANAAKRKMQEAIAKKDELMGKLAEFANIGEALRRVWDTIVSLKDRAVSFISNGIQTVMNFVKGGFKALVAKLLDACRYIVCAKISSFLPGSLKAGFENLTHEHWPRVKKEAMCVGLTGLKPEEGGEQELAAIQVDDELGGERGSAPEHPEDDTGPPPRGGGGCFGFCSGTGDGITDDEAHDEALKVFERFKKATSGVHGLIDAFKDMPFIEDTIDTVKSTVGHIIPGLDGSSSSSSSSIG